MPDLFDTASYKVGFFNFQSLYQMVALTPEALLAMLRTVDKLLEDYTASPVFQAQLPLLNINLADVLSFVDGFEKRISARMQQPKPIAKREKSFLRVEANAVKFPYAAEREAVFTLTLDAEEVPFAPFASASSPAQFNNCSALVKHLNNELMTTAAANRLYFTIQSADVVSEIEKNVLELRTPDDSITGFMMLSYDLSKPAKEKLLEKENLCITADITETCPDGRTSSDKMSATIVRIMIGFDDGQEDSYIQETGFTTWTEFIAIVVEELGEMLGITGVDVTFEKVDGRWELLFALRIPFGFDRPATIELDLAGDSDYGSAGIDADIAFEMLSSPDHNFVKLEFGARFGGGESTLVIEGTAPNKAPRPLTQTQTEEGTELDYADEVANIDTFGTTRDIPMTFVLTLDSEAEGGPLEVNKSFAITVPGTATFFDTLKPLFEAGLTSIQERGTLRKYIEDDGGCTDAEKDKKDYTQACYIYEGYLFEIDNVRKIFLEMDPKDSEILGIGIRTKATPFFEPIIKNFELNAKASVVVTIQEAHLGIGPKGEPPVFEVSCNNGKGRIDLELSAKIVNPLNKARHRHRRVAGPIAFDRNRRVSETTSEAISISQLQAYLRGNGTMFDMVDASLKVGGGLSLANVQVAIAGIPVDGWIEFTQNDIIFQFTPNGLVVEKGALVIESSLDEFNLGCFGLKDILNLIEIAIGIFEGDEDEPGGVLSSVSNTQLPFMDVTIGDVLSFIGDAVDLLQQILDGDSTGLDAINKAINEAIASALGIQLVTVEFGIDNSKSVPGIDGQIITLQVKAGYTVGAQETFNIDLYDMMGEDAKELKGIVDVGLTGGISFTASASATIKIGVALPSSNCTAKKEAANEAADAKANDQVLPSECTKRRMRARREYNAKRTRRSHTYDDHHQLHLPHFSENYNHYVPKESPVTHIPCECDDGNGFGWTADVVHHERPHKRERRETSIATCECPDRQHYQVARRDGKICAEAPEFVALSQECKIICSSHTSYYNDDICMGHVGRAYASSACCDHHSHAMETTDVVPHNNATIVTTKKLTFWSREQIHAPCKCPSLEDYKTAISAGQMCTEAERFLMLPEKCRHACSMHDAYYSPITCHGHFGTYTCPAKPELASLSPGCARCTH